MFGDYMKTLGYGNTSGIWGMLAAFMKYSSSSKLNPGVETSTGVRYCKLAEIPVEDALFDSLRKDYNAFDSWFKRCQDEQRDCFVAENPLQKKLEGICIVKDERSGEYGFRGKVLKLCTFKVAESARRQRLGEEMLRSVRAFARKADYDTIYSTAFARNDFICSFYEKHGLKPLENWQSALGEGVFVLPLKNGCWGSRQSVGAPFVQRVSSTIGCGPKNVACNPFTFTEPILSGMGMPVFG